MNDLHPVFVFDRRDYVANWLGLLLARTFGERITVQHRRAVDGGVRMTGYRWRGRLYITDMSSNA